MTVRLNPQEPERPVDLTRLTEDDLLLDQLGRGEVVTDAGEVEAILSGWRASLPAPRTVDRRLATRVRTITASRRPRRLTRFAIGAAAVLALTGGGLTAAASNAGPDSPLWPVTRLMYSDVAESRLAAAEAHRAVADAEDALSHGELAQATRLLDQAANKIMAVDDRKAADVLRNRVDEVRKQLPATSSAAPPPSSPAPSTSTPAPSTSAPPSSDPYSIPEPGPSSTPPEPSEEPPPSVPVELPSVVPSTGAVR